MNYQRKYEKLSKVFSENSDAYAKALKELYAIKGRSPLLRIKVLAHNKAHEEWKQATNDLYCLLFQMKQKGDF